MLSLTFGIKNKTSKYNKNEKIVTIPNPGENMDKLDLSYIVVGEVKWHSHSGKNL